MIRRLRVSLCRRPVAALLLFCLGCAAQSNAPELDKRIERQIRQSFTVPPSVQISIGPREASKDFPNYDSIQITFSQGERKRTQEFLVSKDGKTLVRPIKMDISQDPWAALMSKIDVQGRPVRGNKDAKVAIVTFDDFQCPFCSRLHQTLFSPEFWKLYADRVKVIYKDYPLSEIHPWADHAAVDANCLAAQNSDAYWDFADYVHSHQKDIGGTGRPLPEQFAALDKLTEETGQRHQLQAAPLAACVKAQDDTAVRASVKEGSALGVEATPTMFVNGQKVDGVIPEEQFRALLDSALRDAGAAAPASDAGKPAGN